MQWQDYIPKTFVCLKEGYNKEIFFSDLLAGISVGIIALPSALAFAIGSGVSPERGLFTAIVAGFLISLLGGSRVQIGGPTGAFVVIVFMTVQKHGYEGLALATLLAGAMLILMGIARFGILLKFIPYPVTTGFTTGIALAIFSSQLKDFFGLNMEHLPPRFLEKCGAYCTHAHSFNMWAIGIALGTLASIFALRRFFPRFPGAIFAITLATVIAYFFDFPVETIESRFGAIPRILPKPAFPTFSFESVKAVFPDAITIALLGAIESLLCAVVADGMTGHKHRSNGELVAQGFANIGSVIFGGIPATGALARTTANIKMGAKTPFAGMIHAFVLLVLMLFLAPLAAKIPLAALSAVLIFVAWNMSELPHFLEILKGPKTDAFVLAITFLLTVLIDLTVAVQVGVILAALMFLKKMTDNTVVAACKILVKENAHEAAELSDSPILFRKDVPSDITIFEIKGPFFYSIADQLSETLNQLVEKPRVFILRMRYVPIIDATGIKALKEFKAKCDKKGILFLVSSLNERLERLFKTSHLEETVGKKHIFLHVNDALDYAKKIDSKKLDQLYQTI